jgi:hypothetical protein
VPTRSLPGELIAAGMIFFERLQGARRGPEAGVGILKRNVHPARVVSVNQPRRGAVRQNLGNDRSGLPAGFLLGFSRFVARLTLFCRFGRLFRCGNSDWYSYSLLSNWRHNPSVGLLLKFTSDVTTLVLIRGSNLDALVADKAINLTDRGFQRHRILWVREMGEGELQAVGERGPTIDTIALAEFESGEEVRAWVKTNALAFAR